jgi:hypothetical protein
VITTDELTAKLGQRGVIARSVAAHPNLPDVLVVDAVEDDDFVVEDARFGSGMVSALIMTVPEVESVVQASHQPGVYLVRLVGSTLPDEPAPGHDE